jgi:hypothetical protein
MPDREERREEAATATLPSPWPHCQVCGAPHTLDEPIVCPACGEPVLLWGWAP